MTQKLVIEGKDERMPTIIQEAERIVKKLNLIKLGKRIKGVEVRRKNL